MQHHPSRADLIRRLEHLDPIVVTDPGGEKPSPWRTYVECLREVVRQGVPCAILQDDALAGPGFLQASDSAWEHRHSDLVSFTVQGMSRWGGNNCRQARHDGVPWAWLEANEWVPAIALAWHPEIARCCLHWWSENKRIRWRADDAVIGMFVRACRLRVCATVPSLVDHPDDAPSLMGERTGGVGRTAIFPPPQSEHEMLSIDWSVGAPAVAQRSMPRRRKAA